MVTTIQDIEALLIRLDRKFERVDDTTVLVPLAPHQPPAALKLSDPVLVAQIEVGAVPEEPSEQLNLFRMLLELNASALVHASYALTQDSVVLLSALELVSLDPNELEAVLSDFDLALAEHVPLLRGTITAAP